MIRRIEIIATSSGSDGSAVASEDSVIVQGEILAVHLGYTSQPATTDVVLKMNSPEQAILSVGNANADGWFYPRVAVQDGVGAGATYDGTNEIYKAIPVHGTLNLGIAQGDDEGIVRATVLYRV